MVSAYILGLDVFVGRIDGVLAIADAEALHLAAVEAAPPRQADRALGDVGHTKVGRLLGLICNTTHVHHDISVRHTHIFDRKMRQKE